LNGPAITLAEAIRRCTCSESTLRRKLKADAIEGAQRGDTGWSIPIRSLISAGLLAPTTAPDDIEQQPAIADAELGKLREQNADLRRRAEVAEAIADERGLALDDARLALRALTAGESNEHLAAEPERRRRWFRRS